MCYAVIVIDTLLAVKRDDRKSLVENMEDSFDPFAASLGFDPLHPSSRSSMALYRRY